MPLTPNQLSVALQLHAVRDNLVGLQQASQAAITEMNRLGASNSSAAVKKVLDAISPLIQDILDISASYDEAGSLS